VSAKEEPAARKKTIAPENGAADELAVPEFPAPEWSHRKDISRLKYSPAILCDTMGNS
jgi:hypothetical protein